MKMASDSPRQRLKVFLDYIRTCSKIALQHTPSGEIQMGLICRNNIGMERLTYSWELGSFLKDLEMVLKK